MTWAKQHHAAVGRLSHVLGNKTPALQTIMGSPQAWHAATEVPPGLSSSSSVGANGRVSATGSHAKQYEQLQEVLRYVACHVSDQLSCCCDTVELKWCLIRMSSC